MLTRKHAGAEWLVWFDADTIIMNPHVPWATFLPPVDSFPHIHLVGAKDWNTFNPGVFLMRVTGWSVKVLTQIHALKDLRKDIRYGANPDQDAILWILDQPGYREHVIYQPIEWFQIYEDTKGRFREVEPGDLLVHFPGYRLNRFDVMDGFLERLRSNKSAWHMELDQTSYPATVDAYWSRTRDAQTVLQAAEESIHSYAQGTKVSEDVTSGDDTLFQTLKQTQIELRRVIEQDAYRPKKVLEASAQVMSALQAVNGSMIGKGDNVQAQKEAAGK